MSYEYTKIIKKTPLGTWMEVAYELYRLIAPDETNIDKPLASVTRRRENMWGWFAIIDNTDDNKCGCFAEGGEDTIEDAMVAAEKWLSWKIEENELII